MGWILDIIRDVYIGYLVYMVVMWGVDCGSFNFINGLISLIYSFIINLGMELVGGI